MNKQALRKALRAQRLALSPEEHRAHSARIVQTVQHTLPYQTAQCVGLYWPLPGEVDLRALLHDEKRFLFPRVLAPGKMEFAPFDAQDPETYRLGAFGTREPKAKAEQPSLLLVPLVGFTVHGDRLGYGGGYYDRYLAAHDVLAIGIAFSFQKIEALPIEPTDQRLQRIITEDRLWIP